MEFKNKVAVITGGASGIGRSTAVALAKMGANIVIVDVNRERMAEAQREIEALGRRALTIQCDVAKYDDVTSMAKQAIAFAGGVDILMNNAGVMLRGFVDTLEPADWAWILGINLYGVIHCCRAFLPHMRERGNGYIVNTSSIGGLIGGQPNSIGYSTSKFAVTGFSEVLYKYLKPKGIGVSLLCPGLIRTNLPENFRYVGDDLQALGAIKEIAKEPGVMEPEEVAQMVIDGINKNKFLILTHPARFLTMMERRAKDVQGFLDTQLPTL
ncbi:MAG: SDR family oxidoreductase [Dehalococcoidia bacterium]|nr:SDR family oxidoreductase [Dehalococcoidia bacterium]